MTATPGTLEERLRAKAEQISEWPRETLYTEAADEIASLRARVNSLFSAIQHGDEEHRAWLKEAIEKHFEGVEVPPVRGSGTKEALRARVEVMREALETAAKRFDYLAGAGIGFTNGVNPKTGAQEARQALKDTPTSLQKVQRTKS